MESPKKARSPLLNSDQQHHPPLSALHDFGIIIKGYTHAFNMYRWTHVVKSHTQLTFHVSLIGTSTGFEIIFESRAPKLIALLWMSPRYLSVLPNAQLSNLSFDLKHKNVKKNNLWFSSSDSFIFIAFKLKRGVLFKEKKHLSESSMCLTHLNTRKITVSSQY